MTLSLWSFEGTAQTVADKAPEKTAQPNAKENTSNDTSSSDVQPKEEKSVNLTELDDDELDVHIDGIGDSAQSPEGRKRRMDGIWEDFKRRSRNFISESKEHREVQKLIFKVLYNDQERAIEDRYASPIKGAVETETEQRRESIERFKAFLESHPPHPQYTPDSLYRLGMLMLEEADADFIKRVKDYDSRIAQMKEDAEVDIPYPQRDQRPVINIFTKLISEWPQYRDLDAALYARGYSYFEMGEEQLALRDFKQIVKQFPESEYQTEVWNLIGELHFEFAELSEAIKAYSEVIKNKNSQYYAPAFYKLAWTYYRNDQFEQAVESFKTLINYSDQLVAKGEQGFGLRDEALQYLAISLNEDDWDDDGVADLNSGITRIKRHISGKETYQAELLARLVEIFFENTKYEEAIQTAQYLFETHRFYRRNPEIHAMIILAYDRIAQPRKAFLERDRITNVYVKDGPWYAYNYRDQEAIDKARDLMKDALVQAASYHHSLAQDFRRRADELSDSDAEDMQRKAQKSYSTAALAYQRYLDRYKNDKNTYELLYKYADTLFYSQNYQRALNQYLIVRDSKLGNDYLQDSAYSAVLAHKELVKIAINQGKLPPKPSLLDQGSTNKQEGNESENDEEKSNQEDNSSNSKSDETGPIEIKAEEIPQLALDAIKLRDEYLKIGVNDPNDPHLAANLIYKIGEIYVDYQDFKPAREHLIEVIEKHSKAPVAENAAILLIETYRIERKWKEMAEWAERVSSLNLGEKIMNQAKLWKVGALFKSAERLQKQKKFKEAALEYIRLVDQNPDNKYASKALYNGAVAFEQAKMFDSAMRTFERIYKQFPKSDFAEDALFRVAYNAQRFYNYDRAVKTFVELAKRYPKGANAAGATFNAARLLEQTQQYQEAAKAYLDYSRRFADQANAAESFYNVARCYEKLGDWRNQIKIYEQFIKKYGSDEQQHDQVIQALYNTAKIYEKQNQTSKMTQTLKRLIKEFETRQLFGRIALLDFPAEAQFKLIEPQYQKFTKMKIKGNKRQQGQIIKSMKESIKDLSTIYAEVIKYKSLNWTIAVFYRLGIMRRIFAQALYELPMPAGLTPEEEDTYTGLIEEIAVPIEDKAVEQLEEAYRKAREFKIANDWTRKILAVLNLYKPNEYPTFKDEKRLETPSVTSTSGFLLPKEAVDTNSDTSEKEETKEVENKDQAQSTDPAAEARQKSVGIRTPKVPDLKNSSVNSSDASDKSSSVQVQPLENPNKTSSSTESSTLDEVEQLDDIEEIK